jgi:hypothetical protein
LLLFAVKERGAYKEGAKGSGEVERGRQTADWK